MLQEIKKKMNKFGSIVTYFDHAMDTTSNMATLNAMKNIAAFVDIHHIGTSFEKDYGVNWIGYKVVPPAQRLIGHVISQIRGDGLVVFVKPSTLLSQEIERLYQYAEDNRMQRAYGFYVGPSDDPIAVGVAAPLLEHLFHVLPQELKADGRWIRWISGWVAKTLAGGRYFDATSILTVRPDPMLTPIEEPVKIESKPVPEHPAPPEGWDPSTNSNVLGGDEKMPDKVFPDLSEPLVPSDPAPVAQTPAPSKKKAGRPKKK